MNPENLRKILKKGLLLQNEPMSRHTSFKTGGPAAFFAVPFNETEACGLIRYLSLNSLPWIVTGNGSDLLVSDQGYPGVVVNIGRTDGSEFVLLGYEETEEGILLDAGAGCLVSAVARIAESLEAAGFEALSGIPGCIGGALSMNAGAYGTEISDLLRSVRAVTPEGKAVSLSRESLSFRYRGSSLADEGLTVLRAEFLLRKGKKEEIRRRTEEFAARRREKQPLEYPSAGSAFKRPEGCYAGKLIEDCGLKGCLLGGAQVSEKHCGFIINRNGASSSDVYRLIRKVQRTVREQTGVLLEPEIRMIGEFPDE